MNAPSCAPRQEAALPRIPLFAAGRRHFLLAWLLPPRALKAMRRSRLPLLLTGPGQARDYRKVVVGTDFSPESVAAARTAFQLAPSAQFIFVHACRLPDERLMRELELRPGLVAMYREQARAAAQQRLQAFLGSMAGAGAPAMSGVVAHGRPDRVLDGFARRHGADLMVIGRRAGQPRGWPALFGATLRLVCRPCCDLLVGGGAPCDSSRRRALARLAGER